MKQLLQNYKTGELELAEILPPALKPGGVLVKNHYSLVSAGTEKYMKPEFAVKSNSRCSLLKWAKSKGKSIEYRPLCPINRLPGQVFGTTMSPRPNRGGSYLLAVKRPFFGFHEVHA
ncbi:MAG: hypothetical protein DRJ69_00015 [Thermoprotei archaeon]|nr:MAG: hypothetical protein DRJ69_00015 [Thermoprotei archaeon]